MTEAEPRVLTYEPYLLLQRCGVLPGLHQSGVRSHRVALAQYQQVTTCQGVVVNPLHPAVTHHCGAAQTVAKVTSQCDRNRVSRLPEGGGSWIGLGHGEGAGWCGGRCHSPEPYSLIVTAGLETAAQVRGSIAITCSPCGK